MIVNLDGLITLYQEGGVPDHPRIQNYTCTPHLAEQ